LIKPRQLRFAQTSAAHSPLSLQQAAGVSPKDSSSDNAEHINPLANEKGF